MRVGIVFGTRPELIKVAPLIIEGRKRGIDLHVISTGQHREMLVPLLAWFEIGAHLDLDVMLPNQTLSELSSRVITKFDTFLKGQPLDYIIVQGDTTSAFVVSLVAFYHKIRVVHIEAGLRTYNKYSPWPEEINRRLISVMADYHFAPTEESALNLVRENIKINVFVTGNTVIDALQFTARKVATSNIFPASLSRYFVGDKLSDPLILVTGHRRENWGNGFSNICAAIAKLATQNPAFLFVYPVHLNPNVRGDVHKFLSGIENVLLLDPLNYPEFVAVMNRSFLILTDSGGVQEEAPGLGKPVLVMRDTTERPEGIKSGCVRLVGTDAENIIQEVQLLIDDAIHYSNMAKAVNPFGDGNAAELIFDHLLKD